MDSEAAKKGFWSKFYNFLAVGGIMIVIFLGGAILIFFLWLTGK